VRAYFPCDRLVSNLPAVSIAHVGFGLSGMKNDFL
jgi:hypothetical protein